MSRKYPQFKYTYQQWTAIYGEPEVGTPCLDTYNDNVVYFYNDTGVRDMVWCGETPKEESGWSFDVDRLMFADPDVGYNHKVENGFDSEKYLTDLELEFEHEALMDDDYDGWESKKQKKSRKSVNESGHLTPGDIRASYAKMAADALAKDYNIGFPRLAYALKSDNCYWIVVDGQIEDAEFPGEYDTKNIVFQLEPPKNPNDKSVGTVKSVTEFDGYFDSSPLTLDWIKRQVTSAIQIVLEERISNPMEIYATPKALSGRPLYREWNDLMLLYNGDESKKQKKSRKPVNENDDPVIRFATNIMNALANDYGLSHPSLVYAGIAGDGDYWVGIYGNIPDEDFPEETDSKNVLFKVKPTPNAGRPVLADSPSEWDAGAFLMAGAATKWLSRIDPKGVSLFRETVYVGESDDSAIDLYNKTQAVNRPLYNEYDYKRLFWNGEYLSDIIASIGDSFHKSVQKYWPVEKYTWVHLGYAPVSQFFYAGFQTDDETQNIIIEFELLPNGRVSGQTIKQEYGPFYVDALEELTANNQTYIHIYDIQKQRRLYEEANSTYELDGKMYDTVTFTSEDDANTYLEENPGYRILATDGGTVHVAKNSDKGTPVEQEEPEEPAGEEEVNESMSWNQYTRMYGDPEPGTPCYSERTGRDLYFSHEQMGSDMVWCTEKPGDDRGWYFDKSDLLFEEPSEDDDDYDGWESKKSARAKAVMEKRKRSSRRNKVNEAASGPVALPVKSPLMHDDYARAYNRGELYFRGINLSVWLSANRSKISSMADIELNGGDAGSIVYLGYDPEGECFYAGFDGTYFFDRGESEMRGILVPFFFSGASNQNSTATFKNVITQNYDGTFFGAYDSLKRDFPEMIDIILT